MGNILLFSPYDLLGNPLLQHALVIGSGFVFMDWLEHFEEDEIPRGGTSVHDSLLDNVWNIGLKRYHHLGKRLSIACSH